MAGLDLPADGGASDLRALRELIAAVRARLPESELGAEAVHEQEAALERLGQRFEARFDALERVTAAVAEVREVTSPREMLLRAPAALCSGLAFERAILSLVKGSRMNSPRRCSCQVVAGSRRRHWRSFRRTPAAGSSTR